MIHRPPNARPSTIGQFRKPGTREPDFDGAVMQEFIQDINLLITQIAELEHEICKVRARSRYSTPPSQRRRRGSTGA